MRTLTTLAAAALLTFTYSAGEAGTWESRVPSAADTYVRDGSSSGTNFGAATSLVVKTTTAAGNTRISFLRFAMPTASGNVLSARLRLYGNRPTATTTKTSPYAVADIAWSETAVTFAASPEIGDKVGAGAVVTPTARYYEWDVSDYVRTQRGAGAPAVSLALKYETAVNDSPDTFNSKEAASNKPELRITFTDDMPPTVAEPASTYPPETEAMSELFVLGADDHGEAALTYTWSVVGGPAAPVQIDNNGTNMAKHTWATFHKAGMYAMQVVIRDESGLTATSAVDVTVVQKLSRIEIRPPDATIPVHGGIGWSAWGFDQFGDPIDYGVDDPTVPFPTWSVTGGGTVNSTGSFTAGDTPGQFTVSAEKDGVVGSTMFTVAAVNSLTIGPIADAFVRDGAYADISNGASTRLEVKASDIPGSTSLAYLRFPISGITSNVVSARLRLFGSRPGTSGNTDTAFAVPNNNWSETTITWNNRPALGESQGAGPAVGTTPQYWDLDAQNWVRERRAAGATSLTLAVKMDNVTTLGADVFNSREAASARPLLQVVYMPDIAPSFERPASASPTVVTGKTTQLSALGTDDGGEAALTYTWAVVDNPCAFGTSFSANGTNAAKNTTVTFANGFGCDFEFEVTVRDAGGKVAKSRVRVSVESVLTTIQVNPTSAVVGTGEWASFFAKGFDQFGSDMGSVDDPYLPNATWTVSGGGTMNGGAFLAGPTPGGPFTVTVSSLGVSATATVRVVPIGTVTLAPSADAYVRDGGSAGTNFGGASTLEVKLSTSTGTNRIAYLRFPISGVGSDVTQATLRLYGSRTTTSNTYYHHANAVASTTWTESGLTWNNRPPMGARQGGSVIVGTTPQYWEWDVTAFVREQRAAGKTAVSLAIEFGVDPISDGPTVFNSKEAAANRPQLVVTARQP